MSKLINDNDLGINLKSRLNRAILPTLKRLFGIDKINKLYEKCDKENGAHAFIKSVLRELEININLRGNNIKSEISKDGALIIVSNMPQGAIDALILLDTILEQRSDVKILVPKFIEIVEPLRELLIVNNKNGIRKITKHLQSGGVLVAFPGVEILHPKTELLANKRPVWDDIIFRVAQHLSTPILPIAIYQVNSRKYFLSRHLAPAMATTRTLLEIINKRGSEQLLLIGRKIEGDIFSESTTGEELSELTRLALALSYLDAAETTEEKSEDENIEYKKSSSVEFSKSKEIDGNNQFSVQLHNSQNDRDFVVLYSKDSREKICSISFTKLSKIVENQGEEGCKYYNSFEISRKFPPIREEIIEMGEIEILNNELNSVAAQKLLFNSAIELFKKSDAKYILTTSTVSREVSPRLRNIIADYTLKNYIERSNTKYIEPRASVKHIGSAVTSRISKKIINNSKYFLYFMHDRESSSEIFTTDFKCKVRISNKIAKLGINPKTKQITAIILIKKEDVPRGTQSEK